MGLYRIRANYFRLGDNETITYIFIDKYLGGVRSALALIRVLWIVGLSLVAWRWIYLFVALALLSVANVLFGMKCYHLHEEYLASLRK